MRNWNSYFMISAMIISIALFATGKIGFDNMLSDLHLKETLIVFFKSIAVMFVSIISLALMIVILLVDVLITIVSGKDFPISSLIYEYVFLQLVRGWYWDAHSGSHIFMASILMFGLGLLSFYLSPVRRKKKK